MKIPKKWRGAEGNLHHFVNQITDSLSDEQVIISKVWHRRHKSWRYKAEKRYEVENILKFNKRWRSTDVQA